jgi:hypothetical protein
MHACVDEGCSASLIIAREKQTENPLHLSWSYKVENSVSRDVITGKVYEPFSRRFKPAIFGFL